VKRLAERDSEPKREEDADDDEDPIPRLDAPSPAPVAELAHPRMLVRDQGS
jgi:hypothetical protein